MQNPFTTRIPNVKSNSLLRIPQREAFNALMDSATSKDNTLREIAIVLPVGCGKSGCITLAPFAFLSKRTLVIAPGLNITNQLIDDFNPSTPNMFYKKCAVLDGMPYPEPAEIRGKSTNLADLNEAHVVITNIQQLQGSNNAWLQSLPTDFFDLILFDEGHRSVADSWETLRERFTNAKIVNFSATPMRADGQIMPGKIVYSYPIACAMKEGYVKRLKAVRLNPRSLTYVRREDSKEIEVSLEEVRRLGEEDADFRRSIVTSATTLATIVDASINELHKLRTLTGEKRLKIIASALNFEHCRQIVQAYSERGLQAGYVHSLEEGRENQRVLTKLNNHELDVIVQVRKLAEGFDHPFLAVAAVFSIFSNLSPFVQFIGRIMRVIVQNEPSNPLNQGVVVFHSGANIARQWADFQVFSEADQEYFDQLLPLEDFDPEDTHDRREGFPELRVVDYIEVKAQSEVLLEEIPLVDDETIAAIRMLQQRGFISGEFDPLQQQLQPVPMTKVAQRQAMRKSLDMRVRTEASRILHARGINPAGHELDKNHLGKENLIVLKSAIDRQINNAAGKLGGQRHELSRADLDNIDANFATLVAAAVSEVFNGN